MVRDKVILRISANSVLEVDGVDSLDIILGQIYIEVLPSIDDTMESLKVLLEELITKKIDFLTGEKSCTY
jgi:hypothetical protein